MAGQTKHVTNVSNDDLGRHLSAAETYQLAGDLNGALIENRAVVSIALQRIGLLALEAEKYDEAIKHLTASVAINDNSLARASLAVAYLRLGRRDEALSAAQSAVDLDPQNVRAYQILGSLHYGNGNYESALPALEKVLQLGPDFDGAYMLGITYLRLRQLERAKLLFEEILQAVRNKPDLHIMIGQAFEETGYPDEAERQFKTAIALNPKIAKAHFFLGFVILQHGGSERLSEAGKEFELELKLDPLDFYTNFFAGVVASSESNHKKAVVYLQRAIRAKPTNSEAYLFLGQSQIELNDMVGAEKSLRLSLRLSGGAADKNYQNRRTHFLLGRLLMRTGRTEEGGKELAKARELQGQFLESAREEVGKILGQVVSTSVKNIAAEQVVKISERPSKNTLAQTRKAAEFARIRAPLADVLAQAYHNLGVISVQRNDLADGLEKFSAAAEFQPSYPGLDRNWGIVGFRSGQFEKAIGPLSRHLKTDPKDNLVRRMLGASYYLTRKYKSAVETLKPIELQLEDAELAYFYGISLQQLQHAKEAEAVFSRLITQNPQFAQARFYAAQGFAFMADFEQAVKEFRAAAAIDPTMLQAHYNAGLSLIKLNRMGEAEKEFREELRLNPADGSAKYHLAFTFLERKINSDEAFALLNEVVSAQPNHADAHYQLGKLSIEKGEIDKAIAHLEAAAGSEAKKDYIYYQLSIAYRRASRKADADRALKIYSDLKAANRQPGAQKEN